jgi:glycosyltransferase involved in cell wall biosynthesis
LYFCEGFTDIRLVVGLANMCDVTMATPAWKFHTSGLADRIAQSGASLRVDAIEGRRPVFQAKSFIYLLRNIRKYDVVLSEGMVRGSLNSTVVGKMMNVPVVTYLNIPPLEYWRCRRERNEIAWPKALAGEAFIRFCMSVSGRLATISLGTGVFLKDLAGEYSRHPAVGYYCGVDVSLFKPVDAAQRRALRLRHDLPVDKFLIFFASRISHEKDPETVLRATATARAKGIDAVLINLGGGFQKFLKLAGEMGINDAQDWVIGRPAVHPMHDLCEYFQAADLVIQSSLAEGCGFSPLEALACGIPVVATNVGGMAVQLKGYAQLTPRRDADAMAQAIAWVAGHPTEARDQAMKGRRYVEMNWRREKAFSDLKNVLEHALNGAAVEQIYARSV